MSLPSRINDQTERETFEKAYQKMIDEGIGSIMVSPRLIKKRQIIRDRMISYYEKTEEFEKCKFVKDFFESIDSEIKSSTISDIVEKIKREKES